MIPRAGGQYVYLREAYSPLWGFLYGWTLFLVIQTGTIAAVAVAFARFLGVLVPSISPTRWIVAPIDLSSSYAISLSTQQAVAILLIVVLTAINTRGLRLGKLIQNVFTSAKTLALVALIVLGIWFGLGTGGAGRELRRPLDRARRPADRLGNGPGADPDGERRPARPARRALRRAGRLAVLVRRLEQRHLRRRRGQEPAARRPARARRRHALGHRCSTCSPTSPISARCRSRPSSRRPTTASAPPPWG